MTAPRPAATPLLAGRSTKLLLFLMALAGAVLVYLLSTASANTALFAQEYPLLLGLNGLLATALLALLGYQLWRLGRRLRAKVFGSRLTLRLLLLFAVMALLPGLVVYGASVQFLSRSIESWFDVRVERALEEALSLGRSVLDNMLRDLNKKADVMALTLAERPAAEHLTLLNSLREQATVQEATLFTQRGTVVAFSSGERAGLIPDLPGPVALRQLRLQQPYRGVESVPDKGLYLRVLVPVSSLSLGEEPKILQLLQPVPAALAKEAETVQSGYEDYQKLSLSRVGLKRLYGFTLTLTLVLALLIALLLALFLSERFSAPLSALAEGTRAVAQGDYSLRHPVYSNDELGVLTQSFNAMTDQLRDARLGTQRHQAQVEAARAYLESILAHLSSGVLSFDRQFRLRSFNPAAAAALGERFGEVRRLPLLQWPERCPELAPFCRAVTEGFGKEGSGPWEREVNYEDVSAAKMLLVRGKPLPAGGEAGYVVVFDDVTRLIQAQRDAAWGEVARRLAHEIKNPLTPIQLSAERLQHKLADRLAGKDAEMLARATATIVSQVTALKAMVDAFSQYARTPELRLRRLDLNRLVRDVLALYESGPTPIRVELAEPPPAVQGDPTLLRQVIHNLLRNAQDALEETAEPRLEVRTESASGAVRLVIQDNGPGFPEPWLRRAFEPYVTTKPKGTGLGLPIVKKIVEEHGASVQIENMKPCGARVTVAFPVTEALREPSPQTA